MSDSSPSMLKATVIGGSAAGFVASVPVVSLLNGCCCALVISGGFLAAFLDGSVHKVLRSNAAEDIVPHFDITTTSTSTELRLADE